MATQLTIQELPANGAPLASLTYVPLDIGGMSFNNDSAMFVVLRGLAAPAASGIEIIATPAMDSGRVTYLPVVVSSGQYSIAGPFKPRNWNRGANVDIQLVDATDMEIAVIRLNPIL